MKAKKVVLFIVEGPSDESALSAILSKVYDRNSIRVRVIHGDITTEKGVQPHNIIRKVNEHIKDDMKKYGLRKSNMQQVIHLMDTDGAYVPDDAVKEIKGAQKTIYNVNEIITDDRTKIIDRNKQKRANMSRLAQESSIGGIAYTAIYMSSNLDHVLYDKLNSDDETKRKDSLAFAKKYMNDIKGFISFITNSKFSVAGSLKETWEYIKDGQNSLARHTNLGICLPSSDQNEPSENETEN